MTQENDTVDARLEQMRQERDRYRRHRDQIRDRLAAAQEQCRRLVEDVRWQERYNDRSVREWTAELVGMLKERNQAEAALEDVNRMNAEAQAEWDTDKAELAKLRGALDTAAVRFAGLCGGLVAVEHSLNLGHVTTDAVKGMVVRLNQDAYQGNRDARTALSTNEETAHASHPTA